MFSLTMSWIDTGRPACSCRRLRTRSKAVRNSLPSMLREPAEMTCLGPRAPKTSIWEPTMPKLMISRAKSPIAQGDLAKLRKWEIIAGT